MVALRQLFDGLRDFKHVAQKPKLDNRGQHLTLQKASNKIKDLFALPPGCAARERVAARPALKCGA